MSPDLCLFIKHLGTKTAQKAEVSSEGETSPRLSLCRFHESSSSSRLKAASSPVVVHIEADEQQVGCQAHQQKAWPDETLHKTCRDKKAQVFI